MNDRYTKTITLGSLTIFQIHPQLHYARESEIKTTYLTNFFFQTLIISCFEY